MKNKLLILFFLLLSLGIFTGIRANAKDNGGKIEVDKTAVKEDVTYGRDAIVNLNVKGNTYNKHQELEIVFVLDRSSSMNKNKKMETVKNVTIDTINKILPSDNIKIGIVTFGTDVLDWYSTNKLTNNSEDLVKLVNSIPNTFKGQGTNISSALEQANSLFSDKDINKYIVLLSDGMPTYFKYNNDIYGDGKTDNKACVKRSGKKCTLEYTPSEYTKLISNEIRKNNIFIFGVGFDASDSVGDLFKNITDKYYNASNEKELSNNFNDIVDNITLIGKDIVITDTIPSYFEIYKEELLKDYPNIIIINNIDGTTTLKFKIDNFSSLEDYNFKYKVIAKKEYYGYMYTNTNAIIEGESLIEGAYPDNKISEVFPKPLVEIPGITKDDSYSVKLGNTLEVNEEQGILNNDYLSLINEKDIEVTNKIIVNNTNNSCGNISVDNSGKFIYTPEVSCLGKEVTFEYYIESLINGVIVKSNSSLIKINVSKDNLNIINSNIVKTGTKNINNINDNIKYNINYSSLIDNYIGNAIITIVDYLPCKIDKDKSNLDSGIYNEEDQTITWKVNINDINTYTNGKKIINIVKDISIKYENIIDYRKLTNKVYGYINTSEGNLERYAEFDTNINIYGDVIVSYVDNDDNKLLEDKKISDLVNNDYLTREEKIDGYTLVDIIGEVEGKIGIDTKYVKYIYYKNNSKTLPDLIKTGTSRIDNLDNKIDYNIKYKSKINDYIGTLEVTIIDYLPYKIDIDNSLLGDFTYNPRDNTLTYKYTKEVNTYLNGEFDIDISLDITLKYLDINLSSRIIKNKVTSYIITDKKKELTDECITNIDIKSNVLVEYVDTLGNKIDNDIIITNFVGNDYITNAKDIKGYTFKEVLGEVVGKHQFSDIKVTYIYEKNKLVPPKTGNSEINYIALTIIAINLIMGIILKLRRVNI